jgi:hypothetical protein
MKKPSSKHRFERWRKDGDCGRHGTDCATQKRSDPNASADGAPLPLVAEEPPARSPSPSTTLAERERTDAVQAALAELPSACAS